MTSQFPWDDFNFVFRKNALFLGLGAGYEQPSPPVWMQSVFQHTKSGFQLTAECLRFRMTGTWAATKHSGGITVHPPQCQVTIGLHWEARWVLGSGEMSYRAHRLPSLDVVMFPFAFLKDSLHTTAGNSHSQLLVLRNNPRKAHHFSSFNLSWCLN